MNIRRPRDAIVIGLALIIGIGVGWVAFHGGKGNGISTEAGHSEEETIWTCSMHPQIRMEKPGLCPICGMDLIPLENGGGNENMVSTDAIQMTAQAVKIADIQTMTVRKDYPRKEISLLGKVRPDERNIAEITARFGGRIEKLHVNFTGQRVRAGDRLAAIYSPALISAQRELLEAKTYAENNSDLYNAARTKLKLWNLSDAHIDAIERRGNASVSVDIFSPIGGTVTMRNVAEGEYVKEGTPMFRVIDLKRVWVMFEAYESDLSWLQVNDSITFTIPSLPGKEFAGKIDFIDPLIDPKTRVAEVRVAIGNSAMRLKPGMFANGTLISSHAGSVEELLIPKSAVLWTGKRAVVYVKLPEKEQSTFVRREVVLGPATDDSYVVAKGLQEGDEIAVNGVFKIDAAAQLAGKPSMMNPEGGKESTGHDHGSMDMKNPVDEKAVDHSRHAEMVPQKTCPVMGGEINREVFADYQGKRVYFCCAGCPEKFLEDPKKYLQVLADQGEKPQIGGLEQ